MTKASVLQTLLPSSGTLFVIDPFLSFEVQAWQSDPESICSKVSTLFGAQKVIVRSSAMFEDHHEEISPGEFHSELNVDAGSDTALKNAIKKVIESYNVSHVARTHYLQNQVIVQSQLTDPVLSGVFDSSDPFYYLVEYTENSRATDDVTSGKACNRVDLFKSYDLSKSKWGSLINAAQEIVNIFQWQSYQLEFSIDSSKKVHIFQAKQIPKKPLAATTKHRVSEELNEAASFVIANSVAYPIWSDMTDWNPSEMLGEYATPLQISLYQYLVTDQAWAHGRQSLGYRRVKKTPLVTSIAGKPYVNAALSFASFQPAGLSPRLSQKLLMLQLGQLRAYPEMHDKVEFELLITCKARSFSRKADQLSALGLDVNLLAEFENKIELLTTRMLNAYGQFYQQDTATLQKLERWRKNSLKNRSGKNSEIFGQIKLLLTALKKCRDLGVVTFARQARYAFIAKEIFDGLSSDLTESEMKAFWNFPTVTSELMESLSDLQSGQISKALFSNKFGHLRPSTYNIESPRYDEMDFEKLPASRRQPQRLSESEHEHFVDKLNGLFNNQLPNIKMLSGDFVNFARKATQMREYAKFVFSATLSDALEIAAQIGENLQFSKAEMQMLDFKDFVMASQMKNLNEWKEQWRKVIAKKQEEHLAFASIKHPALISSPEDFYMHYNLSPKPNFTTNKVVKGEIVVVAEMTLQKNQDLNGKIVCIAAADPGYDWIFSYRIAGLITKYGGAASHMGMRCAQFGIPAAIGCGTILFDELCMLKEVVLDCKRKQIIF